jgi:hypothetical protein
MRQRSVARIGAALLPDFPLTDEGPLGRAGLAAGAGTFRALADMVEGLPYGRITASGDWTAVLAERRGTCSSKHALLAATAYEHGRPAVELLLGVFVMSEATTPGVGETLAAFGLAGVPEAHCYLRCAGQRVDLTGLAAGAESPFATMSGEIVVAPADLPAVKVTRHQEALAEWARTQGLDPAPVWAAREACIAALSAHVSRRPAVP